MTVKKWQKAGLIDRSVDRKGCGTDGNDDYETVRRFMRIDLIHGLQLWNRPDNQNICSVFLDKKSFCNRYAKQPSICLTIFGIPALL